MARFIILFVVSCSGCSFSGYAQEVFKEAPFTRLIDRSNTISKQREKSLEAFLEKFDELNRQIRNNSQIAEAFIKEEYDFSKQQVQDIKTEGVVTDLNIGVQALTSGDVAVGGLTAAFGLWNSLERNKLLKEKAREDKLAYEEAQRQTERVVAEATQKANEQKAIALAAFHGEIRAAMNKCPPQKNTTLNYPKHEAGAIHEFYFYAIVPLFDRIYLSSPIRVDLYNDNTWHSTAYEYVKKFESELATKDWPELSNSLKTSSKSGDYIFPQGRVLYSHAFLTRDEALGSLNAYAFSVVETAKIPILPLYSATNVYKEQITTFLKNTNAYWGNNDN